MTTLPEHLTRYFQSELFTQVPTKLAANHSLRGGTWARIKIVSGTARLVFSDGDQHSLSPEQPGVVPPQLTHHLEPTGPVAFYVEFFRQEKVA